MYGKTRKVRNLAGVVMILTFVLYSCTAFCPADEDGVIPEVDQIVGDWFGVSVVSPNPESPSKCSRLKITNASSESFSMRFTAINGSPPRNMTFNAEVTFSDMKGMWNLVGSPRSFGPMQHRFLSIGTGHAVLFFCGLNQHGRLIPEHAIIMSSTKKLDPHILTTMKTILAKFVPREKIIDVEQKECT